MKRLKEKNDYDCWLGYYRLEDVQLEKIPDIFADIAVTGKGPVIESIRRELKCASRACSVLKLTLELK